MTADQQLKAIEDRFRARGLNPYEFLPVCLPESFLRGVQDAEADVFTLKIAKLLEKILEAMEKDNENKKGS